MKWAHGALFIVGTILCLVFAAAAVWNVGAEEWGGAALLAFFAYMILESLPAHYRRARELWAVGRH